MVSFALFRLTMNHQDHVNLLRDGIATRGGTWADFGSGTGAFTLALADLIGSEGEIFSVDKNRAALQEQARAMHARFPNVPVHYQVGDFARPLGEPLAERTLDGIVMANALHFIPDHQKDAVIQLLKSYLRPGGRLILVEYNADRGNVWVPYPVAYPTWETIARRNDFANVRLLATRPSRMLNAIYSAENW